MFAFIKRVLAHSRAHPFTLIELLQHYTEKQRIDKGLHDATLEKYRFFIQNIAKYLDKIKRSNLTISEVRVRVMEDLRVWLITEKKCGIGHASRHLELCKRAMRYAMLMEYIKNNPLDAMRAKRDQTNEVVHLEDDEIKKWVTGNFSGIQMQRARDLAIVQMFTGMSYADLQSFEVIDRDGKKWISNRRAKNSTAYYVPLFPEAAEILERYQNRLPDITNQFYNRQLKLIASRLGIKKRVTTHTMRKTFATMMDQKGVSPKTTATMLGNTVQVLEKHYVAKSPKRMEKELAGLGIVGVVA